MSDKKKVVEAKIGLELLRTKEGLQQFWKILKSKVKRRKNRFMTKEELFAVAVDSFNCPGDGNFSYLRGIIKSMSSQGLLAIATVEGNRGYTVFQSPRHTKMGVTHLKRHGSQKGIYRAIELRLKKCRARDEELERVRRQIADLKKKELAIKKQKKKDRKFLQALKHI